MAEMRRDPTPNQFCYVDNNKCIVHLGRLFGRVVLMWNEEWALVSWCYYRNKNGTLWPMTGWPMWHKTETFDYDYWSG